MKEMLKCHQCKKNLAIKPKNKIIADTYLNKSKVTIELFFHINYCVKEIRIECPYCGRKNHYLTKEVK